MGLEPTDWNPEAYDRFRGFRLRPALDLLAQVPTLPAGDIVDLGCGSGAVGPALTQRWPERRLLGVDSSVSMLETAGAAGCYARLDLQDAAAWTPDTPPALIFSNALLHWVPDHAALLPRLTGLLAAGGTLAFQVPDQQDAPSHALLRAVGSDLSADWEDPTPRHILSPADLQALLAPLGRVALWHTQYYQYLAPAETGHPVRHFTASTAMRPHVAGLTPDAEARFVAAYDLALHRAYPLDRTGGVLFPFKRLFAVLTLSE